MAEDFYTQWLGVPPGRRPPDHYQLLGLPRFTPSARAIDAGARAQLDKLDQFAISPDAVKRDAATRMMNEVAGARLVLADPARRRAYDAQLRAALGLEAAVSGAEGDSQDTVVGSAPTGLDALDVGAFERAAGADAAGSTSGSVLSEPDSMAQLFREQSPLQELEIDGRSRHRTMIPFSMVLVAAGLGALVIVVAVVIAVAMLRKESPPPSIPDQVVESVRASPPPVPVFEFRDEFNGDRLGPAYAVRSTAPAEVKVVEGQLRLVAGEEQPARVDLTPRRNVRLFREVSAVVALDPGAKMSLGITSAARITLERRHDGIHLSITPGRPVAENWPVLPDQPQLVVRLIRREGTVYWEVDGQMVGTSPDMSTRGYPAVTISGHSLPPATVAIDGVTVRYDPDLD